VGKNLAICLIAAVTTFCGLGLGNQEFFGRCSGMVDVFHFLVGTFGLVLFFVLKEREGGMTFATRSLYVITPAISGYGFGHFYATENGAWGWRYDPNNSTDLFVIMPPGYYAIFLVLGLTPVGILVFDMLKAVKSRRRTDIK
jgi:hypothetical protein